MIILGLDFDNTLVHYDKLFRKLAIERGLINETINPDKIKIRDYLRECGEDEKFTLLQGEVYGKRILEAEPPEGMLMTISELQEQGISIVVVSHKTKTPYKGPAYDLHKAAMGWLKKNGFFSKEGLGWEYEQIYFEETKEKKIAKILSLGDRKSVV